MMASIVSMRSVASALPRAAAGALVAALASLVSTWDGSTTRDRFIGGRPRALDHLPLRLR